MEQRRRKTIEGRIDKARNHLEQATTLQEQYSALRASEVIEACQESTELSVKSILDLLEIRYARSHGWSPKQLEEIPEELSARYLLDRLEGAPIYGNVKLPRLITLANFWAQFYSQAKYGIEAGYLASAQDLFTCKEAELAVVHAQECYQAVSQLRYLREDQLDAINSR